jgi:hypothetical protein
MTGNLEYLIEPRNTTSRLLVPVLPSRNAHIQHSPSRPIQPTHLLHLHVARDSSGAGSALWARLGSKMVVIDQPHQTMWSWGSVAASSTGGLPCVALPLNCLEFLEREAWHELRQNRRLSSTPRRLSVAPAAPAGCPAFHMRSVLGTGRYGTCTGPDNSRAVRVLAQPPLANLPKECSGIRRLKQQNDASCMFAPAEKARESRVACHSLI